MKFIHMGDCHLGSWRQPELKELNFQYFQEAVKRSIQHKPDFILISGDLFDNAYPPIDTLKQAFEEFRKIKEANIPLFLIAGSHDYSVSGKTFLDVLEKAGFSKNVAKYEEKNGKILLEPTLYKNVAIYGYPGKKSGLEVEEVERIKLQDCPGLFKILMLHTTIRDAIGDVPVKAVDERYLPKVDYVALSHLHINYKKGAIVYSGPVFPNNVSELEELRGGSFYFYDNGVIKREEIKIKEILPIHLEVNSSLKLTEEIINILKNESIKDKIIIIRLSGILEKGKISDIDFNKIETYIKENQGFALLRSISKLHMAEPEVKLEIQDSEDLETHIIKKFEETNQSRFNIFIPDLIRALQIEKLEDEASSSFEDRLLSEVKKVIL